jgi:hypothetical protein
LFPDGDGGSIRGVAAAVPVGGENPSFPPALRRATGEVGATEPLLATAAVPAPPMTATLPAVARNRGAAGGKPRDGGSRGAGGGGKPGGGEEQRQRVGQRRGGFFTEERGARGCHARGEARVPREGSERTLTEGGKFDQKKFSTSYFLGVEIS